MFNKGSFEGKFDIFIDFLHLFLGLHLNNFPFIFHTQYNIFLKLFFCPLSHLPLIVFKVFVARVFVDYFPRLLLNPTLLPMLVLAFLVFCQFCLRKFVLFQSSFVDFPAFFKMTYCLQKILLYWLRFHNFLRSKIQFFSL